MLLDYTDIALLRLTGWCRNLPAGMEKRFHSGVFLPAELELLRGFGLLYPAASGAFYRLRPAGYRLLGSLGLECPRDSKYVSDEKTLRGRREAALIMLTFYRAGFHIFLDSQTQLKQGSFLPFASLRRNRRQENPFPGLSLVGVGRTSAQVLACYYPDEGCICLGNELSAIDKLAAGAEKCLLFCGGSYPELAGSIQTAAQPPSHRNNVSYAGAYRKSPYPVRLLECSDVGAAQLLLSIQPDFRDKLARLALGCRYAPPPRDLPGTDALYQGKYPVIIGVDMDVSRIQKICQSVRETGYPNAIVIAFREQLPALARLCVSSRPELFGTSWETALERFGLSLYEPPPGAYPAQKGGYLHASALQANRKTGK